MLGFRSWGGTVKILDPNRLSYSKQGRSYSCLVYGGSQNDGRMQSGCWADCVDVFSFHESSLPLIKNFLRVMIWLKDVLQLAYEGCVWIELVVPDWDKLCWHRRTSSQMALMCYGKAAQVVVEQIGQYKKIKTLYNRFNRQNLWFNSSQSNFSVQNLKEYFTID